jgi:hypothetical protein
MLFLKKSFVIAGVGAVLSCLSRDVIFVESSSQDWLDTACKAGEACWNAAAAKTTELVATASSCKLGEACLKYAGPLCTAGGKCFNNLMTSAGDKTSGFVKSAFNNTANKVGRRNLAIGGTVIGVGAGIGAGVLGYKLLRRNQRKLPLYTFYELKDLKPARQGDNFEDNVKELKEITVIQKDQFIDHL